MMFLSTMLKQGFLAWALLPPFGTSVLAQNANDDSWVPFDKKQFTGNTSLDDKGDVRLFWKTGPDYSTYGIASKSKGYLAIGFSETGAMTGADIAVGYANSQGKFVLDNRNAAGFVTPQLSPDQKNNIRLKEGSQKDGVTGFVFEKKNKADCLQTQVDVSTNASQWFIYAHSDDNTFAKHAPGNNGKKYIQLGTGPTVSVNEILDVPGSQNFTITQTDVVVPKNETTYCYTMHKLPAGSKNYIVGERPGSTSPLLHHQVVYSCYGLSDEAKAMVGQPPNCDWLNFGNPCVGFVAEWAPGMAGRTFKDGYGKPFGSDSFEYVMLETHFNNPDLLEGQKASPGYTFLYTDKKVDHEIGSLTLGEYQVTGWTLEPGKQIASRVTVCTPDCTKNWPADGITAVSVFFHMHQRGRNERVQLIRDGKEIAALSSLRHFEYGYQYSKDLGGIKLLPGDRLITTCEYDTTADKNPVPGGFASKDEMCFAWVDYYPANDVLVCTQVDLGQDPRNLLNGTTGFCLIANQGFEKAIQSPASLNGSYQSLPASGGACDANSTQNQSPSASDKKSTAALMTYSLLQISLLAVFTFIFSTSL